MKLPREGFKKVLCARLRGIEPERFGCQGPGLNKSLEFGVQRRKVEMGTSARWIEAAGALEMWQGRLRIASQEHRQAQLLVCLGPVGRPFHRNAQPSNRFDHCPALQRQRPEVERDLLRCDGPGCDRVRQPREPSDGVVGAPGKDERADEERRGHVDVVAAVVGSVEMSHGFS